VARQAPALLQARRTLTTAARQGVNGLARSNEQTANRRMLIKREKKDERRYNKKEEKLHLYSFLYV
jgi:hypothetical protein